MDHWIERRKKALQPMFWDLLNDPTFPFTRGHRITNATTQSLGSTATPVTKRHDLRDGEDKRRYGHHTLPPILG